MALINSNSYRLERNMQERYRRRNMKDLLDRLAPLVHPDPSKLTVLELADQAISFVKQMEERIEKLKEIRRQTKHKAKRPRSSPRLPVIGIRCKDSIIEVNLTTGLTMNFMLYEIILVLEQEGAEVISCSYRTAGDSVFFTVISQAIINPTVGMGTLKILEKLKEVIF